MQRFAPYLRAAIILAFAVFIIIFANSTVVPQVSVPSSATTASSTLSVEPGFLLPPVTLPSFEPKTDVPTSTSSMQSTLATEKATLPPQKKTAPTPTPTPIPVLTSVVVPVPVPVLAPTPSSGVNAALDASASALRAALVNIICYAPVGSPIHSISGSGVFIDPKGIILTNAHVAQFFLLADRGVSCTIRAGSPAANSYEASLMYISPAWINANATILTQTAPRGTGEYDFAFLAVTKSTTSTIFPSSFPYVPLATTPPASLTPVVIASYGAQFLASSQVQSGLFPTIVFGLVKDVYTFAVNTIDVLALGGSAAAQEGSSGGGVADAFGKLVGTITTSTVEGATDTRFLDAITASYIRSDFASETGQPLDLLLEQDPATAAANFAPQIPALESILTAYLP